MEHKENPLVPERGSKPPSPPPKNVVGNDYCCAVLKMGGCRDSAEQKWLQRFTNENPFDRR